jgi:hypothetical protein
MERKYERLASPAVQAVRLMPYKGYVLLINKFTQDFYFLVIFGEPSHFGSKKFTISCCLLFFSTPDIVKHCLIS